jgi:hypothetical protein
MHRHVQWLARPLQANGANRLARPVANPSTFLSGRPVTAISFPFNPPARRLLQTALEHAAGSLVHYRHTHALSATELPLFKAVTRCMLDVVLPYLVAAFSRVFTTSTARVDSSASAALLRQLLAEI